VHNTHATPQNT